MKRENRYIVVKIKDAEKHLSPHEFTRLRQLAKAVDNGRIQEEKHPMECVVIESDWPEYEKAWQMIGERVDALDHVQKHDTGPEPYNI